MKKNELQEFLKTINFQYWNKLSNYINDVNFLNAWYEALKDYEYDLILYVYKQYNNTDFPPTAKYFQIEADKIKDALNTAITMSIYSLCSNCYLSGEASYNKKLLEQKLSEYPYGIKGKVLVDIVGKIPVTMPSYSVDLAEILKDYEYER